TVQPQTDPALAADVLRNVEHVGSDLLQRLANIGRGPALERDATVAVVIDEKVAEASVADLQMQVLPARTCDALGVGQTGEELQHTLARPIGARWLRLRWLGFALGDRSARAELPAGQRLYVVKANEVHVRTGPVLRRLEQVHDACEPRLPRELRR